MNLADMQRLPDEDFPYRKQVVNWLYVEKLFNMLFGNNIPSLWLE